MTFTRTALIASAVLLAGCGKMTDLKPAAGQSLPVKPLMAKTMPTAKELLTPPAYANPERVDRAYVTSCDVPLLVPGFVTQMLEYSRDHDIAVMEIDGFPHPLSAVYRRAVLPHVETLLAKDRLRPVFLFDAVRTRRVHPAEMTSDPELRTLRNLNTPDDYQQALRDAGF